MARIISKLVFTSDDLSHVNELLQLQAFGWQRTGCSFRRGRSREDVAAADRWQAYTLLPGMWAMTSFSAVLDSSYCLATSILTFCSRTRTPTQADLSSTGCWLSILTLHRDQGTWSSARGTCWIFSLKVALKSCLSSLSSQRLSQTRLSESAAGKDWGVHGFSNAVSRFCPKDVQTSAGFCPELNSSHKSSPNPAHRGQS